MRADARTEEGSLKKERWVRELNKHLPDYKFEHSCLKLCKCHFRAEDLFVDTTTEREVVKVKPGCVPDVAMGALKLRIYALEEERDILRAENNTLKSLLTAEQFEQYTNMPVLSLKKKRTRAFPKRDRPNDDSTKEPAVDSRAEQPVVTVMRDPTPPPSEKRQHVVYVIPCASSSGR